MEPEESDGSSRRKTGLRTLRLPEETIRAIEEACEKDHVSFNSLVNSILSDYSLWTRKAKEFGFMYISRELFRILLEASDAKEIERLAREQYSRTFKSMAMYWFQDASPASMLKFLRLFSQHNWQVELHQKVEGKNYTLTFHHDLGPKFSLYLRTLLNETIKNELHSIPAFDEGGNSVEVRFELQ